MARFRSLLADAPRWLLLGLLLYAPWAYGCTREWAIEGLIIGLGAALGLWGVSSLLERRWPPVPALLLAPAASLLLQGWWMALNAHSVFDGDYLLTVPAREFLGLPGAPGSVEGALSRVWMGRATVLLGTACFVAGDLARRPAWLLRLWWVFGLAGASVAALGLLQRVSGAENIFWQPLEPEPRDRIATFFGPYLYHANAGAFLNLTLPLTAGLCLRAWLGRGGGTRTRTMAAATFAAARFGWGGALLTLILASAVNTSRAAQLLAVLLVGVLLLGPWRPVLRVGWAALAERRAVGLVIILVVAGAIGAIAWTSGLDRPWQRWAQLGGQLGKDARWGASGAAWGGIFRGDAGWLGLGPGTFPTVFPYLTGSYGDRLAGVWLTLHEDYLQTVLEWGWLGAALWTWVFAGGLLSGAWRAFSARNQPTRRRHWTPRQRLLLPVVVLALGGVALHALVDFPLQIASLQLYVAVYLGLCWGSRDWGTSPASEVSSQTDQTADARILPLQR